MDLTANLASILRRYPFGNGVLREIVQNTEDARAKKQVLIILVPVVSSAPTSIVIHPDIRTRSQNPSERDID